MHSIVEAFQVPLRRFAGIVLVQFESMTLIKFLLSIRFEIVEL